jgi:hypothetical protein
MKPQTIAILLSSALVMSATTTAAMAQTRDLYERNNEFNACGPGSVDPRCYTAQYRDPYERNNEFNSCTPGSMDPRCYTAQYRDPYERNNEFNICEPGNMDPRCYSASGGGRYNPDLYDDDEDE